MKTYMSALPLLNEPAALDELLARADRCRERIEPSLAELLAADARLAEKYPFHSGKGVAVESAGAAATTDLEDQDEVSVGGDGDAKRQRGE